MPMLFMGSTGPFVTMLQQALNLGETSLAALDEDGIFGMLTRQRVQEFQSQSGLVPDGTVGPKTYAELQDLYQLLAQIVLPVPPTEAAARTRIQSAALAAAANMGWTDDQPSTPVPASGRIAADYGDGTDFDGFGTQFRIGGATLATIHQVAGSPDASKCLTISSSAMAMYSANRVPPAAQRNAVDLPEWCGIFALYIYRVCGLKMPSWTDKPFRTTGGSRSCNGVTMASRIQPGDVGVLGPNGRNHHFVVVNVNGATIDSVDGNAGFVYQSIKKRQYTLSTTSIDEQGFFRTQTIVGNEAVSFASPRWDRVLS
jgi:Putative peptidoglycan binding domain